MNLASMLSSALLNSSCSIDGYMARGALAERRTGMRWEGATKGRMACTPPAHSWHTPPAARRHPTAAPAAPAARLARVLSCQLGAAGLLGRDVAPAVEPGDARPQLAALASVNLGGRGWHRLGALFVCSSVCGPPVPKDAAGAVQDRGEGATGKQRLADGHASGKRQRQIWLSTATGRATPAGLPLRRPAAAPPPPSCAHAGSGPSLAQLRHRF